MKSSAVAKVLPINSWISDSFAALESQSATSDAIAPRKRAFSEFSTRGLPTRREEDWKYTDISALNRDTFEKSNAQALALPSRTELDQYLLADCSAQLVFINGHYVAGLSRSEQQGFQLSPLSETLRSSAKDAFPTLTRDSHTQLSSFVALNTALFEDGALLHVSAKIAKPIQLLFFNSSKQTHAHTRVLIKMGKDSAATVIETYASSHAQAYVNDAFAQFELAEGAALTHYKLQLESEAATHIATTISSQASDSKLSTFHFNFGGAVVRNEIHPQLAGENISANIFGLTALTGSQHVDNHTVIDHAQPNCESHEHFKGVYAGSSAGVFNGTIIVRPDAQKTNAIQTNNNIVLSEGASVDTRPQLKIWANDVKCTHGATVGKLDDDSLFYLRARGIDEAVAKRILTEAFAAEIIERVELPELREFLQQQLAAKLAASFA